jgi:hypothetical protein
LATDRSGFPALPPVVVIQEGIEVAPTLIDGLSLSVRLARTVHLPTIVATATLPKIKNNPECALIQSKDSF